MHFCGCVSLVGAHFYFSRKGVIMDQQPHTESEAAPPTSEQQGTLEKRVSESATVEGNETAEKPHNRKRTIAVIAAISIVIIAICVFALTYCPHEWTDANCTSPKTCQKCGKTEGEPLGDEGHIWESATCTKPKTCSVCGKTEGTALGHKW